MTVNELVAIAQDLGLPESHEVIIGIVKDMNWAYTRYERQLREKFPRGDRRIIEVSPLAAWKLARDPEPLRKIIARGTQTPEETAMLLKLFDDTINPRRGGLASRRRTSKRSELAQTKRDAAWQVWLLQLLLATRMGKRGSRKRAMQIVSLYHRLPYGVVEQQVARGPRHPTNH